jgi:sodium transport system permease protein
MRPRILYIIAHKELREALRDRRTLFMMIALPILLYPLLILGMSRLQEGQQAAQTARNSRIALWGNLNLDVEAAFKRNGRVELMPWKSAPEAVRAALEMGQLEPPPSPPLELNADDVQRKPAKIPDTAWAKGAQQALLQRDIDAVLILWPGFDAKLARGELGVASILYDSVRPESGKARDRASDVLRQYRAELLKQREKARNLASGFATGIELQSQNLATEQRKSGMLIGMLLPYMLILFSAMSGFYAAIDMTAGEKERGTMQTLLCAPLYPLEIIAGKFLAVWAISLIATLINIVSLSMTFARVKLIPGLTVSVPPEAYLIAFFLVLPVSILVNSVFLAVGAFARDFKDGQNFLTPILMGLLLPLALTTMPGIELNGYLAFAPIVNIALMMKGVFLNEWKADLIFLVLVSSLTYAMLALALAAKVFEQNNLLLGGRQSVTSIFDFSRRPGARPTAGVSMLAFSVALVLAFYASLALEGKALPVVLLVTQVGFFLAPALLLAWSKGFDFRPTFSLRPIGMAGLAGCVLIGISAWTVGGGLLIRVLPPPESLVRALEKLLLLDDRAAPLWQVWIFVALLPAVCEEMLFRGLILSGFRSMGKWPAIVAAGLLFGVAHASIYRLLPTLFLGIIFGWVVWRTGSVLAGMICHMLNNGLMATLAHSRDAMKSWGLGNSAYLPWAHIAAGTAVLLAGLWLVSRERGQSSETTA